MKGPITARSVAETVCAYTQADNGGCRSRLVLVNRFEDHNNAVCIIVPRIRGTISSWYLESLVFSSNNPRGSWASAGSGSRAVAFLD